MALSRGLLDSVMSRGLMRSAAPAAAPVASPAAPAGLLSPSLPGMTWDDYSKSIAGNWNLSDQVHGFGEMAKSIGYTGPVQERTGKQVLDYEGESGPVYKDEYGPAASLKAALQQYRFSPTQDGDKNSGVQVYDQSGNAVTSGRIGSSAGSAMKAAGIIIPALVASGFGAGALGAFGMGPMAGADAAGAASGAGGAGIGAGDAAAQVAAYTAANPLTAAEVAASTLPAGGLPGLAPSMGAGLLGGINAAPDALQAIESYTAANPLTASQVAGTLPSGGLPGLSGMAGINAAPDALKAIESYTAANPLTPAQVSGATLPSAGLPGLSGAGSTTLDAIRAAEHADMGQTAGNIPKTVDMGSLGGTTATTGGLQGAWDVAQQVGGNALSGAGDVASWMKANPSLGKLLVSGAMGLLSSGGGSSGGSSAPKTYGPAQNWSSPIQQGLLSNPQQINPAAIQQQRPQGLLAQGQQYDGAWRYMGGK